MKTLFSLIALCLVFLPVVVIAEPAPIISTEPKLPPKVVELEEIWSVGGEDGEIIFGMMTDSVEDPDGNIYMLDAQLCHVEVFSAEGEHLRTISNQGDGPGEVRNPQNLVLFSNNTIGILELFPAKFVNLSLEGEPQPGFVFGGESSPQTGFSAALQATNRGGTCLVSAQHSLPSQTGQSRTQYLANMSGSGEELSRYRESTMTMDFSNPTFVEKDLIPAFMLANTVDNQGRVYTARAREKYLIEAYNQDGTLARVFGRQFENRKRDKTDLRRLNALIDAWFEGFPGEVGRDLDSYEPPLNELHVDDNEVLWVMHSRSGKDQPEGIFLTYDTFSLDGDWLQEVSFKADANPDFDGIKFLGGDRALLIKGFVLSRWASRGAKNVDFGEEDGDIPMEVIYCKIVDAD
jgi:hypothetical protein